MEIVLKISADVGKGPAKLITYEVAIHEDHGRPVVAREILKYRRRPRREPCHFVNFSCGSGEVVTKDADPQ